MTEVTQYRCDICKQLFDNKEKALKCEKHHTFPVRVKLKPNQVPGIDEVYGCPRSIIVEMDDGRSIVYGYNYLYDEEHKLKLKY